MYYSIPNSIAGRGFVAYCASKKMVTVVIDGFGAFADVMLSIVEYFETEFPFESYCEDVVFDSLAFLEAGHGHKGHRCAVV